MTLAGKLFSTVRIDVVARPEEVSGVERRQVPDLLAFAGIPTRMILVTDLCQQYAEKLHALTRTYLAGESTRVKDLVDLVLLVEDGVPADRRLVDSVKHVFAVRRTHPMPTALGPPPAAWQQPFEVLANEIGLDTSSHEAAHNLVAKHWRRALDAAGTRQ